MTNARQAHRRPGGRDLWLATRKVLMLGLWSLALTTGVAAEETGLQPFPDMGQILEAGRLRVGLAVRDLPPLLATRDNGEPAGIEVTIARGLAKKLDVKAEFLRTAKTPDDLVRQAARGEVDIALSSISRTPGRALYVRYSRPYLTDSWVIGLNRARALREGVSCPESLVEAAELAAQPDTMGALVDGAGEELLKDANPDVQLALFKSRDEMVAAIESGELLAGISGRVQLQHVFASQPASRIRIEVCLLPRPLDHIAVVIRPDAPNLQSWIDMMFEDSALQLDSNQPLQLDEDWML